MWGSCPRPVADPSSTIEAERELCPFHLEALGYQPSTIFSYTPSFDPFGALHNPNLYRGGFF